MGKNAQGRRLTRQLVKVSRAGARPAVRARDLALAKGREIKMPEKRETENGKALDN